MLKKLKKLQGILKKMRSVLVAYSGGADSTFLLKVCCNALKDKCLAVTADSLTYTKEELSFAKNTALAFGVRHYVIKTNEMQNKQFIENSPERCYFCKKELFQRLKKIALKRNLGFVIDASNTDDINDFRPGRLAKIELGVRSPLEEAGINKKEIRILSKKLGLSTWNKPQLACLSSRLPYGVKITAQALRRIEKAEREIRALGFRQVRVRHYDGLCRIEALKNDIPRLLNKRTQIVGKLKKLGYNYVTVDLEGYRPGSMNQIINDEFRSQNVK